MGRRAFGRCKSQETTWEWRLGCIRGGVALDKVINTLVITHSLNYEGGNDRSYIWVAVH